MSKVVKLTKQNFDISINSKLAVVDFYADWCTPCKMIAPHLDKLSEELSAGFYQVNSDLEPELTEKYNVRSLPCVMLFSNGKPIDGFIGFKGIEEIRKIISKHIA